MKLTRRSGSQQFFAGLTILSVTFTYGCFAFGWRSCLQTMNAITSPKTAKPAAGISPAKSLMGLPPFFFSGQLSQSSGVNQVPMLAKTNMTINVHRTNEALNRPVTNWPISAMEIKNSVLRPRIAATYFFFALLNLTTQAYHAVSWRAIGK